MANKIKITINAAKIELIAELLDTETAKKIWDILPIKSTAYPWGKEIYFDIPVPLNLPLEQNARAEVEIGEIGYWDVGNGMAIFFGPTPASAGDKPIAASAVNVFGNVIEDVQVLDAVKDGDEITVEKYE